jgi:beta-lactamase regulating signal transducer with metallopeptidase domain
MILLLEAALRGMLLGALIWALLRLIRLKDARAETQVWTSVLLAALAMPLLAPALASFLPGLPLAQAAVPAGAAAAGQLPLPWLLLVYGGVTGLMLARLVTGLALTWRLYRAAEPVTIAEAATALRRTTGLRSPIVFGRCILVPHDFAQWPAARRAAVLAHEECHVARGDFFLQLLAGLYRALFWFNPFAWWLKARLGALAERDSDSAALARMGDRASYAELLMEMSRLGRPVGAEVAMSGPGIAWRIDHILDVNGSDRRLGRPARLMLLTAVAATALGFAAAHAEPRPASLTPPPLQNRAVPVAAITVSESVSENVPRPTRRPALRRPIVTEIAEVEAYNPRALLDAPAVIIVPAALLASPQ